VPVHFIDPPKLLREGDLQYRLRRLVINDLLADH
jgi:hypothetical protein